MNKAKHKIPAFKSEAEERAFWEQRDSSEYVDWSQARTVVFPRLKPLTQNPRADIKQGAAE